MRPEDLIDLWRTWDEEPGNAVRAGALVDAIDTYAGARSIEFRRSVNARRSAGYTLHAAIYAWTPP